MKRAGLGRVSVRSVLASVGVLVSVAPALASPAESRLVSSEKNATSVQVGAIALAKGEITGVQVAGFKNATATGQVTIEGRGACRLRVATYRAPYEKNKAPIEAQVFDAPVELPATIPMKRPAATSGGDHVVEVQLTGAPGCSIVRPAGIVAGDPSVLRKVYPTYTPSPALPAPVAGLPIPPSAKPATGTITSLQVPGGSFAEDEAQKLQVFGAGGCALDLAIKKVDAAGGFDKTFDVKPLGLDGSPSLYNGTHFDTLAEGSYSAKVTGKNGCSGTATIDFKVTPKTSTKLVKGQPNLSLEKGPIAGPAFKKSKDSNIVFVVKLPMDVKDEPNVAACEVEYDFKNAYGGWEVYGTSSPIQDGSFGGAVTQPQASVYKSVSGFKEGTEWRMRVRAYQYKTQFEWSDWLYFQVDQN